MTGLTGLLTALSAIQSQIAPPVAHLREMNVYVAAALDDGAAGKGCRTAIPRVAAPAYLPHKLACECRTVEH